MGKLITLTLFFSVISFIYIITMIQNIDSTVSLSYIFLLGILILSFFLIRNFCLFRFSFVFLILSPFTLMLYWPLFPYHDWGAGTNLNRFSMFQPGKMNIVFQIGIVLLITVISFFVFLSKPTILSKGKFAIKHIPVWIQSLLIISIPFLNTLSARKTNIFEIKYGTVSEATQFGGGYVIGYSLFIFILLLNYHKSFRSRFINGSLLFVFFYELIFNNILVGSREIVGLAVVCFLVLSSFLCFKYKVLILYIPGFLLLLIFLSIGAFRGILHNSLSFSPLLIFNNNPWNSMLLNVLGYADSSYALFSLNKFEYYYNLFISILPSAVRNVLSITSGISSDYNPGHWYSSYTTGGVYLPITLFSIFGICFGTLILILKFLFIFFIEKIKNKSFCTQLLFLCITFTLFRWLWYGDINLVRSIQAYALLLIIYFCCPYFFYKHASK